MTTAQAKALKYGDRVFYHHAPAIVQRVTATGVVVSYENARGQYKTERVAAGYLTARTSNA